MATTPAPKIQTVAPEISDSFAAIVDRALAFDRDLRYQTAAEMRKDVRAALVTMPNAQPSHVNLVSTEMRAPDSARAPGVHRPERAARRGRPAFALRKDDTGRDRDDARGRARGATVDRRPTGGARERARPAAVPATSDSDRATRAEPAIARAKACERRHDRAWRRTRLFSPTVLVFAAAGRHRLHRLRVPTRALRQSSRAVPRRARSRRTCRLQHRSRPPLPPPPSAEPFITELDDVDAGEDEDDDGDEEDEAGAPDASRPRVAHPRPAIRPVTKKRLRVAPGVPRKTKKKRWHW